MLYHFASLDVVEKTVFSLERQGARNMHCDAFLELYNKIVSEVFLHFSEELVVSRYINT